MAAGFRAARPSPNMVALLVRTALVILIIRVTVSALSAVMADVSQISTHRALTLSSDAVTQTAMSVMGGSPGTLSDISSFVSPFVGPVLANGLRAIAGR